MKKNIHPTYHTDAKIICACGNVIETGSTSQEMKVEICSACHPFYTGKKKTIDTTGRVDRFKKRLEVGKVLREKGQKNLKKTRTKKVSKKETTKLSKDILKKIKDKK